MTEVTAGVGHHILVCVYMPVFIYVHSNEKKGYFQYGSIISRHGTSTGKEEKREKHVFK